MFSFSGILYFDFVGCHTCKFRRFQLTILWSVLERPSDNIAASHTNCCAIPSCSTCSKFSRGRCPQRSGTAGRTCWFRYTVLHLSAQTMKSHQPNRVSPKSQASEHAEWNFPVNGVAGLSKEGHIESASASKFRITEFCHQICFNINSLQELSFAGTILCRKYPSQEPFFTRIFLCRNYPSQELRRNNPLQKPSLVEFCSETNLQKK